MANTRIQQVTNEERTQPYDVTKEIEVTPKDESKSTYFSMPTDPALLQEIQRQKESAARAYGVNPQTGAVTPFEALGYNPEEERKRREAERALNDRKRKENAWYNAFAVLGDSLTAALGGNVWQRQPNNIGAQANADNARLIAEQKAEDEGNAAKLRAAGLGYSNAVNKLIQNYLTKTTNTHTTGGDRKETTHHPEISKTRQVAFPLGEADGSNGSGGSGSGKGSSNNVINIHLKSTPYGEQTMQFPIGDDEKKALSNKLTTYLREVAKRDPEFVEQLRRNGIANIDNSKGNISNDYLTRLLDEGMAYDVNGEFAADIMNIYIDTLEKNYKGADGKPLSRSQIYEIITGQGIHDADGNLDYYKAKDLKEKGLLFGNERIGREGRSVEYRGATPELMNGNPFQQQRGVDRGTNPRGAR